MLNDVTSTTANERIRHEQESASTVSIKGNAPALSPEEYRILDTIQRRVLWLSTLMIHHANNVRPNPDELKVRGHQASSASMVSILTALYFHYLDAGDRVSIKPRIHAAQLKQLFRAAGWQVLEAKYGQQLQHVFARPGGSALQEIPDAHLHELLGNLGGHDLACLLEAFSLADSAQETPAVVFAYTVKGWSLPFAGDVLNHSMLLTAEQIRRLQQDLDIPDGTEWDTFPPHSPEGHWCQMAAERLRRAQEQHISLIEAEHIPSNLDLSYPDKLSTQEAFGRILPKLADLPLFGERIVSASPDVAVSTHLSTWVSKVGVFAPTAHHDYQEDVQRLLRWQPGPTGQHIELGISEMNLFLLLGQLGLSYELCGQQLFPIGTVYDPFVCRGLDALIYGLYSGSKFIFAGTPSGVSLSPEGGAHQSTVTASLGIELPELDYYEPAFACELEWILLQALRECCNRTSGHSTYLRLSTKKIDQRLLEGRALVPDALESEIVQIASTGAMLPEAVEAAHRLAEEGIAANVLHLTSPKKLFTLLTEERRSLRRDVYATVRPGHLQTLFPRHERKAPIVTVQDASAHSLAFLGGLYGVPTVPLGADRFGQSGSQADLYQYAEIGVDDIVGAGYLAWELCQDC